jgi:carboxymethylenebutenolidase
MSDPQVLADVQSGVHFLSGCEESAGRIGVTGFCMGGMYALMAACACDGVSAAVAFYGLLSHEHGILHDAEGLDPACKPRSPLDVVPELRAPLLAFYGDRDEFVPMSDVRALEARLDGTPHPTELVVVPGAGHAFMNDTRPDTYRPDDAVRAWARMRDFLGEHLRD